MKRRKIPQRKHEIKLTKQAVPLFNRLMWIHKSGLDKVPEKIGGHLTEYNSGCYELCDMVGTDRWQGNPIECQTEEPPFAMVAGSYMLECYNKGHAAYKMLAAASRELIIETDLTEPS